MSLHLATTVDDVDPEIWSKVVDAFAEALGLDDDEVGFDSRVIDELDAESLDFLDIAFRLERAFDIKIPRGGIEQAAKDGVEASESYEVDGVLTDGALVRLSEAMPEVPRADFRPGLRTAEVPQLFRVSTFYNMVVRLLNEKMAA